MSMLDGVSQCWWLSNTCVVDWDAWSTVGTVAAVFAAVFAPAIQRRFVRKKANALFLFAYMHDIVDARASLNKLRHERPVGEESELSMRVEALLRTHPSEREAYAEAMHASLARLSARELDLTKWPAVDLDVAAGVAIAIEMAKAVKAAGAAVPTLADDGLTESFFAAIRNGANAALEALAMAEESCRAHVGQLISDYREAKSR